MQDIRKVLLSAVVSLSIFLSSCNGIRMPEGAPTSLPAKPPVVILATQPVISVQPTATVDVCSSIESKKPEIEKIAGIMEEFDDTSYLVQYIPDSSQFVQVILVLQRIRRDAIENKPPSCLKALKDAQVKFMSGVILTSINMMSTMNSLKSDKITDANKEKIREDLKGQLSQTRSLRSGFDQELANQLGLKYITATPAPTLTPSPIPPTSTISPVTATTDQDIYVVQGPGLNFPAVGTFLKGQIANVIGRSQDGTWIQIDVPSNPGNAGWVPKQLIKLAGAEASLPIIPVEPTPLPAQ